MIRADHLPPLPIPRAYRGPARRVVPAASRWAMFWDDRAAITLKIIFLVCCVAVAALLEAPW